MSKKTKFSRQAIIKFVNPSPLWLGDFNKFVYEKIETNLEYCLHNLHTCWDLPGGRHTFVDLAKKISDTSIELNEDRTKKIKFFSSGYREDMIRVSAFRHKDLRTIRKDEYKDSRLVDDVYIAEDHNHRFTSYALRLIKNKDIGSIPVELYLGKFGE